MASFLTGILNFLNTERDHHSREKIYFHPVFVEKSSLTLGVLHAKRSKNKVLEFHENAFSLGNVCR